MGGCAVVRVEYYYQFKFGINSFAWLAYKARRGVLEKVAIKSVRMVSPYVFLYTDTLNSLYNESDLMTQQEAIDTFAIYQTEFMRSATEKALKC